MWVFSSVAAILDFWVFSSVAAILDFSDNGVELVRYDATGGERAVSLLCISYTQCFRVCIYRLYRLGSRRCFAVGQKWSVLSYNFVKRRTFLVVFVYKNGRHLNGYIAYHAVGRASPLSGCIQNEPIIRDYYKLE